MTMAATSKTHVFAQNIRLLNQFVSKQSGMILPRNTTGVCPKAQRKLAKSIKRARQFGEFDLDTQSWFVDCRACL